ncbi:hypothetical protein F5050DRAFT_1482808 [Lentinula boryana]|uniref:Secreted protein n=1 Tax=Lentinula boryana TaxID=40481 RepID=A0ABQ8QF65_9AGAR|nr:hypothetical protein F5050DRAFT_1482808 [Lentinula boryana]
MVYLHSIFTALFVVGAAPSIFAAPVTTPTTTGIIESPSERTSRASIYRSTSMYHFQSHSSIIQSFRPCISLSEILIISLSMDLILMQKVCCFFIMICLHLTQTHYGGQPPAYMHNHIPVKPQYGLHQLDPASTLTADYVPKATQNPVRGVRRKGMTVHAPFTPGQQSKPHGFRRPGMNAYSG